MVVSPILRARRITTLPAVSPLLVGSYRLRTSPVILAHQRNLVSSAPSTIALSNADCSLASDADKPCHETKRNPGGGLDGVTVGQEPSSSAR